MAYLFWIIIGRHFGEDATSGLAWHEPLVGIALGIWPKLTHDIPLWSLLSFFVVEMIYYGAYRILPRNGVWISSFLIISWLMGVYHEYTSALPLTLGPVMSGLFFYSLGQSFKSKNLLTKLSTHLNTIAIVVILGIFVFISEINSEVNFYICQYGIFFLFISGALFGIMGIITLCIRIGKRLGNLKMIRTISIGTLLICGFHLMIFSLIKGIGYFIFHIQPSAMTEGPVRGLLFALAGLLLCVLIVVFIEKYLKGLTDK